MTRSGDRGADLRKPVLDKSERENFPVASRLLPRRVRGHLMAIYGFARLVDDIGDEAGGDRLALLDAVEADLDRLFAGQRPEHPLIADLAPTVREHPAGEQPYRRLVQANRQDQLVARYPSEADLQAYCELSANPVGRLVLAVFDAATPARVAASDAVCTGLQLVEHCQDIAEDYRRGRIYTPLSDLDRCGVRESDLGARTASPAVRRLVAIQADRARRSLDAGSPLIGTLAGTARWATAGYVAGGRAALAAVAAAGNDVLAGTPRPRRRRLLAGAVRGLVSGR